MARATTSAIAERIDILQLMLLEDSSNSACVAHSSQEWGGDSCRQAYRLLKRAWQRIGEDVDATDLSRRERHTLTKRLRLSALRRVGYSKR